MTGTHTALTYDHLKKLVERDAVAIRGVARLEPAGGPGDKVFPPTHAVEERNSSPGAKYAFETRRIDGREVKCVLLDSVQSQANRMEEALQALWDEKRIALPVICVDFSKIAPEVGRVTSLTAPHRIADALLRDSVYQEDGSTTPQLFRLSSLGRSFTDASTSNAGPLFRVCPTGLLFGLWDSTGPKGGLGAKFQRALVSEIVGINAVEGKKTASRIDPMNIQRNIPVYKKAVQTNDDVPWTTDENQALKDKGGAVKYGKEGKPSEMNHGNVAPTIDHIAGGVTIDEAKHTVVLSIAALRRLGFDEGAIEARAVLVALGLVAIRAAESRGYDLRSRCLLVPRNGGALKLESVARDGSTTPLALDLEGALQLYHEAVERLPAGLKFDKKRGEPLAVLRPSKELEQLVETSRRLAISEADTAQG
ncbi:MAG: type I-U CRISPR-associated RAMP protein Csb1/Cas7u [Myxococcota bacterium]|nr:type I-U CRISPR-associated RAMP protein Csb1/Cas7u [Myxococcota bacterium]MDW8361866.1 type I-U CRISPR-associated RAMP protein Csb1/Cas7u [Myxococcales bacterium]